MKSILLTFFFTFFITVSYSQVGIGTTMPDGALDIVSTNDGLLIPRVSLTSTLVVLPVVTGTTSELVYNTNTAGDVTPGFYYLSSATGPWVRLATASPTSDSWLITGNTNIVDGTNFIGTAAGTNVDVAFKRNNLAAGKIGTNSTSFGVGALNVGAATTSTAFGKNALVLNTRNDNVAVGNAALSANVNGTGNVAVGNAALSTNIGTGNVGIGNQAGALETTSNKLYISNSNTTATTSLIYGEFSPSRILRTNSIFQIGDPATTGYVFPATRGTANQILQTNATGSLTWANPGAVTEVDPKVQSSITNRVPKWDATATALVDGIINDDGTRVGIGTGVATPLGALEITSANDGLVIPRVALTIAANLPFPLAAPTTSEIIYNTATVGLGINAVTPGFYYWTGSRWERFVTGASTGWSTTGNAGLVGTTNFLGTTDAVDVSFRRSNAAAGKIGATSTSFGVGALNNGISTNGTAFGVSALAANTGSNNTAFGTGALAANNTPGDNTAIGFNALTTNTLNSGAGNLNTAVGSSSLAALNGGARNTAVGARALAGVNTNAALDNVAVGHNALQGSGTIDQSVAIGSSAFSGSGGGSTRSTAIGYNAGNNIGLSIDNVMVGANTQGFGATARNQIVIGYNASATADNQITLGNSSIGTLRCAATTITALSDRRDKADIVKLAEGIEFIKELKPVTYTWNTRDKSKVGIKAAGFIAQDLLDLQQKSAIGENLDLVSYNNPDRLEARYGNLLPVIVKAIQEQQAQIEQLQNKNDELTKMNEVILKRLEALENK